MKWLCIGFGLLVLAGCTVESDVRCNGDPQACPSGTYCGGVWCYPNNAGPGDPGALDRGSDRGVDARVDMADRDMARDLAVDMARDLAVDMARDLAVDAARDMADDMERDLATDMPLPDMPPPDMPPPDMPDMGPVQPPTVFALGPVRPADDVLSTDPERAELRITVLAETLDGMPLTGARQLHFSIVPIADDVEDISPMLCDVDGNGRDVDFRGGRGTTVVRTQTFVTWRANRPNVRRQAFCLKDLSRPDGSVLVREVVVDVDAPDLDIRAVETNVDRVSGILPVVVDTDDPDYLAGNPPRIYRTDACAVEDERFEDPRVVQGERLEFRFGFGDVVEGGEIAGFVGAVDEWGNRVCVEFSDRLDAAPTITMEVECEPRANGSTITLQTADDGMEAVQVTKDDEASSCLEISEPDVDPDGRATLTLACTRCALHLLVEDRIGPVRRVVQVHPIRRFKTPWALSHRPAGNLDQSQPLSALRLQLEGLDSVLVTGLERVTRWSQRNALWSGQVGLELRSPLIALGNFSDLNGGLELVLANTAQNNNLLVSRGCRGILTPLAVLNHMTVPLMTFDACQPLNLQNMTQLAAGRYTDDALDDLAFIDTLGRVGYLRGGRNGLVDLQAFDREPRAVDVAIIPGDIGVIVTAYEGENGAWADFTAGAGNLPLFGAVPIRCVEAVNWDLSDDEHWEAAFCEDNLIRVLHFGDDGVNPEVALLQGAPVGEVIVDVAFENGRAMPEAITVTAQGRVYKVSQAGPVLLDVPEPIDRIFKLSDDRPGFDLALRSALGARMHLLETQPQTLVFQARQVADLPAMGAAQVPVLAADLTANFRDDLIYATGGNLRVLEWTGAEWRNVIVEGSDQRYSRDLFPATGDFDGDGRPGGVAARQNAQSRVWELVVDRDPAPAIEGVVPLNNGVDLPRQPWGLAVGPLDGGPADMVAVGVGNAVQIYRADNANPRLLTTIEGVAPNGMLAFGRYGAAQERALILMHNVDGSFEYTAFRLADDMAQMIGQGEQAGEQIRAVYTGVVDGRRQVVLLTDIVDMIRPQRVRALDGIDNASTLLLEAPIDQMAVGDADGDLQFDIVTAHASGVERATLISTFNRGPNGGFVEDVPEQERILRGITVQGVFIGDFNGDRIPDRLVVTANRQAHLLTYVPANEAIGD